jgi:formate hydrogenlyase subunit 3/multisubunit Na+/H+ antiporter MnhD subunit
MSLALMVVTCLATGVAIRLLRRWPRLVFAASLVGAALLVAMLATAPTAPIDFFGRALALDSTARAFLFPAIAIAAALAFFGPLTFERASDAPAIVIANAQGAFFFWSLAAFIVAIALDSFPLAVFFWIVGLIVLMLLTRSQREGRVGGAAQFLLLAVIAGASLLVSNRFFDLYPLTPENLDLIRNALLFLVLGLGLLLAVVPLHIWLGPLADEMPLLGVAFLVGAAQPVGLWLLFERMSAVTWLTEKSPLLTILLLGAAVTVPMGALLALAEQRDGRFVAYLSLISLGDALIGFGLGTRLGLAGALLAMLNRAVGVALIAGGLSFVRHHAERRWQIVGALAILLGGFSLAGIPPALGFAALYPMYRDLAASNVALLVVLLASHAVGMLAVLRVVRQVVAQGIASEDFSGELKIVPYLCTVVVVVLFAIVIITGVFPQFVADPLIELLGKAAYLK